MLEYEEKDMSIEDQYPETIPEELQIEMKLEAIFTPQFRQIRESAYKTLPESELTGKYAKFVHYTSAEAALSIIQNKQLWMRKTNCMSDYREVEHGFDILKNCFEDKEKNNKFTEVLDSCAVGAAQKGHEKFAMHLNSFRSSTYIASISEHKDEEDLHGRLSMWRAYCGDTGRVAIVFKVPWHTKALLEGVNALNIHFSPVAYIAENDFEDVFQVIIQNIEQNHDFICSVGFERVVNSVFKMLFTSTLCMKHSGFKEEQEWRIMYCPSIWPSTLMKKKIRAIDGVPQNIYTLPLDGNVDKSLSHFDLAFMFDRLIIGPTQYAWPMLEAFKDALLEIGIEDAHKRVFLSNIPIRT